MTMENEFNNFLLNLKTIRGSRFFLLQWFYNRTCLIWFLLTWLLWNNYTFCWHVRFCLKFVSCCLPGCRLAFFVAVLSYSFFKFSLTSSMFWRTTSLRRGIGIFCHGKQKRKKKHTILNVYKLTPLRYANPSVTACRLCSKSCTLYAW